MKVITFSRHFPAYHPRKGEPTHFVDKIIIGLYASAITSVNLKRHLPKFHTIRAGKRWKKGDKFSARVWTGKPYQSKQFEFAQLEVKNVWPITIEPHEHWGFAIHIGENYVADWTLRTANIYLKDLAANDGLTKQDLISWFKCDKKNPVNFSGQIICWNETINY